MHGSYTFLWRCISLAVGLSFITLSCGAAYAAADIASPLGNATGLLVRPTSDGSDTTIALIDGGLFHISSDGQTATNVGLPVADTQIKTFAINSTLLSPTFDNIIYVGTPNTGVWKTTDAGITWSQQNSGLTCLNVTSYAVINATQHFANTRCNSIDTIFVSNDGGSSWRAGYAFASGIQVNRMTLSLATAARSFAMATGGLWVSDDSAATWQQAADLTTTGSYFSAIPRGVNVLDYTSAHTRNSTPRPALAMIQDVGMYYSANNYHTTSSPSQPLALLNDGLPATMFGRRISVIDEQFYVPVTGFGIYRLSNEGRWELAISEAALPGAEMVYQFSSDTNIWMARTRTSGIWRSEDGGRTWSRWGVAEESVTSPASLELTLPQGELPEAAVEVNVVGNTENLTLTVSLQLDSLLQTNATRSIQTTRATEGYNVYVVALVPGEKLGMSESQLFVKDLSYNWSLLTFPLKAFMQSIAIGGLDTRIIIEILQDTNMSTLTGTEFYVGYGQSDEEMLQAKRYRGVYKVQ